MAARPRESESYSASVRIPARWIAAAQARLPSTSWIARRWSTGRELFSAQASGSSDWVNRPPHIVFILIPLEPGIVRLGHIQTGDRQTVQRPDLQRQAVEPDKSLCVALVIN